MRCIIDLMTNKLMCNSQFGCDNYGDHIILPQYRMGIGKDLSRLIRSFKISHGK